MPCGCARSAARSTGSAPATPRRKSCSAGRPGSPVLKDSATGSSRPLPGSPSPATCRAIARTSTICDAMTSPSVLSNRPAVLDTRAILDAVDAVLADAVRPVELHEPRFGARERELVLDCIDTGWVSTAGKYVGQFEQMVSSATGVRHAIAIVNGTAALHAALLAEGVKPNDEVILPSITFVATANAVSHTGAVPHFVDSTWDTLGLDPVALDRHLQEI